VEDKGAFGDGSGFGDQLELALKEAFPILMDRLHQAHFSDWRRRNGLEVDLAQSALLEVFRRCRQTHFIPDNLVAYLVQTAKNIAISMWKQRRRDPVRFVDPSQLSTIRHNSGRFQHDEASEENDLADESFEGDEEENVMHVMEDSSLGGDEGLGDETANSAVNTEKVRTAIDALPRRQRESIEIYVRHREESTVEQMGRMMGISADGFEKNVERAVKRLRHILGSDL
jgi:RNA polymerase sigma factor (sigma-70 family)